MQKAKAQWKAAAEIIRLHQMRLLMHLQGKFTDKAPLIETISMPM